MNRLFLGKGYRSADFCNGHLLGNQTAEVHFNTASFDVVQGNVLELAWTELSSKFRVDTVQHIQVECSRNALSIIVGREDNCWGFL